LIRLIFTKVMLCRIENRRVRPSEGILCGFLISRSASRLGTFRVFRVFSGSRRFDPGRKRRRQNRRRILGLELGGKQGREREAVPPRLPSGWAAGLDLDRLRGHLSGTGGNHREWLERRRGGWGWFLQPDPVSP
jgi:hypothetical protein